MNDSVKFAPFSVGWNGSVNGYYVPMGGGGWTLKFSASGQTWSYPGGYDWTVGGSGSAVAVHSFGSWEGNAQNVRYSVDKSPYVQFDLQPEYDFSAVTGDITLSFVARVFLRGRAGNSSSSYRYGFPSSVRFWSGVQWYDCSLDMSGSSGATVSTVSVTVPYAEAVGITDASFRFNFSDFSYGLPSPTTAYYYLEVAACTEARTLNIYDDESQGPSDPGVDLGPIMGLLDSILGFLRSIIDGITNIGTVLGNVFSAILELPGKLVNLLIDGLKSLFIPSEEDLKEISDKYNGLFESKLGFVYQLFSFVVDSFGKFQQTLAAASSYTFTFPGISFPLNGQMVVIIPQQAVNLDNAVMAVVRPVVGTAVSIIAVLSFSSTAFDMVVAFMSGTSYFEFMASRREQDGE